MRAENAKLHNSQSVKMLHVTLNILGEFQKTKNRSRQKNKPSREESLLSGDDRTKQHNIEQRFFIALLRVVKLLQYLIHVLRFISFASSNSKQQQTPHPNSHHPILNPDILVTQIPLEIY